jgi:hypothetical protein
MLQLAATCTLQMPKQCRHPALTDMQAQTSRSPLCSNARAKPLAESFQAANDKVCNVLHAATGGPACTFKSQSPKKGNILMLQCNTSRKQQECSGRQVLLDPNQHSAPQHANKAAPSAMHHLQCTICNAPSAILTWIEWCSASVSLLRFLQPPNTSSSLDSSSL